MKKNFGVFNIKLVAIFLLFYAFFMVFMGNLKANDDKIIFYGKNNKELCSFTVEMAVTEFEQAKGLMFRKSLPKGHGMLFIHKDEDIRHYWMKNTYIPLDMIFIDSTFTVVDIFKNAIPLDETTISSKAKARYVLEVTSGEADHCKIKIGTKVKIIKKIDIKR